MPGATRNRTTWILAFYGLSIFASINAWAQIHFDLPSQPLSRSLVAVANMSHLSLLYDPALMEGLQAPALKGDVSADEAFRQLLSGTGLQAVRSDGNTVRVIPRGGTTSRDPDTGAVYAPSSIHVASADTRSEGGGGPGEGRTSARDRGSSQISTGIAEILVTSEKTGERKLLETPLSVSAFSGAALEERNRTSMVDVLQDSPGVSVFQFQPGQTFIQIRGISATTGDATAGYYLDDLPFTLINLTYVPDVNPFDLERVEVLRGPQGTLYGAGSEGGAVRILTHNADVSGFDAKVSAFGSDTQRGGPNFGGEGMVNLPLVEDRFAVRLVGEYSNNGGYIDNPSLATHDVNTSTNSTFRGKFTLRPVDDLDIRGMVWASRLRYGAGMTSDDDYQRPVEVDGEFFDSNMRLYNLTGDYHGSWGNLYAASSYITYDFDTLDGSLGLPLGSALRLSTFNEEIRYSSSFSGPLQLTAGLFYLDGREVLQASIFGSTYQNERLASQQEAAFSELHYAITPNLQGTVGLRYFHDDRNFEEDDPATAAGLAVVGVPAKRDATFNAVTPRFNLSHLSDDGLLVYGNIAKGFRSGLTQLGAILLNVLSKDANAPDSIRPENVWSYELGMKKPLFDRTFSVEAAVYYNDWRDLQVTTITLADLPAGPVPIAFVQNTGRAHAVGGDLNLVYGGIKGLTLQVGGNYNDSVYNQDLPGLAGIRKGDRIAGVPALTLTASAEYKWPLGFASLRGVINSGVQHSSARNDYSGGITASSDPLTFVSFKSGVENDRWGVYLTADNLSNERGRVENLTSNVLHTHPRPRTIGLMGQLKY